jgi:branched-chain amino acid transport system substrate-binding protein
MITYDDRSLTEEVVRGVERLVQQDKVDFILPPWGTGFNLAVAPLLDRFGYPHLVASSLLPTRLDPIQKWKNSFWFLGASEEYAASLAKAISNVGTTTNKQVALLSVADGFGIALAAEMVKALEAAGIKIVLNKSYPIGTQSFATLLSEAAASGADTFVACSYPPDTFALTKQARLSAYNPKIFFTGVGTGFPIYPQINEGKVEGVMSLGGIDASRPTMKAYIERHKAVTTKTPDYWGSPMVYTSLQMLEQAIARKGLDKAAVSNEIRTGTFDTIVGKVKLVGNRTPDNWLLGQWQNGVFVGVEPSNLEGAGKAVIPKPAWGG